jgi:hypothetical protein
LKLNDLKVIHDLYSQYLIQTLSKTTSNMEPEGVKKYESMHPLSPEVWSFSVGVRAGKEASLELWIGLLWSQGHRGQGFGHYTFFTK